METWTEADWDSWDEGNHGHMKAFFQRVKKHHIMRIEVAEKRKESSYVSLRENPPCPEWGTPEKLSEMEQDAWLLTFTVSAFVLFTLVGLYLIK